MIVPDINLLVYAYNSDAPRHREARGWWEGLMNGQELVGIPWVVSSGFVRLMTHPRILATPMIPKNAVDHVASWFNQFHVRPLNPGPGHLNLFRSLLSAAGIGGDLVTDAHIAAIAIEYQAEVHSNDTDFSRFSGLHWKNPI